VLAAAHGIEAPPIFVSIRWGMSGIGAVEVVNARLARRSAQRRRT